MCTSHLRRCDVRELLDDVTPLPSFEPRPLSAVVVSDEALSVSLVSLTDWSAHCWAQQRSTGHSRAANLLIIIRYIKYTV